MASLTETFDELIDDNTYPGLNYSDATFEINILGDASLIEAIDGGGGDIWIRSFNDVWDPLSNDVKWWYQADEVDLTGSDVDEYNDLSGNARHVPYAGGGTKQTQTLLGGRTVTKCIAATSQYSQSWSNDPNTEGFVTIMILGGVSGENYTVLASNEYDLRSDDGDLAYNGVPALSQIGGCPLEDLAMTTWRHRNSNPAFLKVDAWTNGDVDNLVSGSNNGVQDCSNVQLLGYGSASPHSYFAFGLQVVSDIDLDEIQRYEGIAAWNLPGFNKNLPSDHPYRYFSPTGNITVPDAPTVEIVRISNQAATVYFIPGNDGGADVTYEIETSPGGAITTVTSGFNHTITGLSNGSDYTFRVRAVNAAGAGSWSSSSDTATPSNAYSPTALYRCEESSTVSLVDWVAGTYTIPNETATGGTRVAGQRAFARSYNGSENQKSTGDFSVFNAYPFSIFFRIKTSTNDGNDRGIWRKYSSGSLNGIKVALVDGKVKCWYFKDGSNYIYDGGLGGVESGVISDGNWHSILIAITASGGAIYVDGNPTAVNTRAWTGTAGAPTSSDAVYVGKYSANFSGVIDEMALFPGVGLVGADAAYLHANNL